MIREETARHHFFNAGLIGMDCLPERDTKHPLLKKKMFSLGGDMRMMYFEVWRATHQIRKMAIWDTTTWKWLYIPERFDQLSTDQRAILDDYATRLGLSTTE